MFSTESLFPAFEITIPSFVEILNAAIESKLPDSVHQMWTGRSPFDIEQVAVTDSSKLKSSPLKLKGAICGRTAGTEQIAKFF